MPHTNDDTGHAPKTDTDQLVLLTVRQVANLTGISRSKLYEYLSDGRLKSVYVGKSRRIRRIELALFLASLSEQPGD